MSVASPAAAAFVSDDRRFGEITGDAPRLVRVVATDAHEGPVYVPGEDALYFTSLPVALAPGVPHVAIKRVQLHGERFPVDPEAVSVVSPSANVANGMTLDHERRLVVCEQGTRSSPACISRFDPPGGEREVLVDGLDGLGLNSPNDVVVKSDGTVWFTDPSYGFLQHFRPEPMVADAVYRYAPRTRLLRTVATTPDKPNGLAFSPGERTLYVADSGANEVVAFDVEGDVLGACRALAQIGPGSPDGIKTDAQGRIYVSCASGVQVLDPNGECLGEIQLPGAVNFTFGGRGRNVLFITTDTAVWAAVLNVEGA